MAPRGTHRIALISDLHGNETALREVLRAIERQGADEIVCLGDVATLGPAPSEVVDRLRRIGCRCIAGNHDDYLFDPALARAHGNMAMVVEAIDWCRAQLTRDQLEFVRSFERGIELRLADRHRVLLFHGSPQSNMVDILAETSPDELDRQLGPERAAVMACGHTHVQMLRQHRGTWVVNPGSVGAPFREYAYKQRPTILPHAEYAILAAEGEEVRASLHRLALDRGALAAAALASTNPMRAALAAPCLSP